MTSDTDNDGHSRSQSPDEGGEQDHEDTGENYDMAEKSGNVDKDGQQKKPASNAKDPSRPRRKKARRACYACQRAHLTCGDERPCQRCIKRGLQDACADGVRKKAKYLHDAPPEALMPGGASHYQYITNLRRQGQPQSPQYPLTPVTDIYNQRPQPQPAYPVYNQPQGNQMPLSDNLVSSSTFSTQPSPISAQFSVSSGQPSSSTQSVVPSIPQSGAQDPQNGISGYDTNIFDANDLNQYNFDPDTFNFGNHYGALEFGMLGQISSGAAETPPGENGGQMAQNGAHAFATPGTLSTTYSDSPVSTQPYMYGAEPAVNDWRPHTQTQSNIRSSSMDGINIHRGDASHGGIKQEHPNAFSIGVGSAFATPTSGLSPQLPKATHEEITTPKAPFSTGSAPNSRPGTQAGYPNQSSKPPPAHQFAGQQQQQPHQQQPQSQQQNNSKNTFANTAIISNKRRGDPSSIYEKVSQPYPYTRGFHNLFSLVSARFSREDRSRIAQALASIRPSFLTCTNTLGKQDLIFMEKCFQRALWEYEDFIGACGTPTLVCRRTGEIAAVGKEFSILTGWRKDVLLGNDPNLNVNVGNRSTLGTGSGTMPGRGMNPPRVPEGAIESSLPQPAFIAELLDDESAVQFYEDFARLAFGDSHGVVTTTYKLLKYRTKEDEARLASGEITDPLSQKRKRAQLHSKGTEGGIDELGDEEGKVECSCCWAVKRDLFDLPMMIVMNFLPCI